MNTNRYAMGKPTEGQLIAYLENIMGPDKARSLFREAQNAGGKVNSEDPLVSLTKAALWLSKQKGLAGVVGQSMVIRIKFYNSIYAKA